MARKDLLSEAIADAKAVKETALANAKLALEEAFTPKLQSMISAKLAEEAEDEDEDEFNSSEIENNDEMYEEGDEMGSYEAEDEIDSEDEEMTEDEDELEMDSEDEEMTEDEDELEMDSEEDGDELDLESIIKELEDDMEDDSEEEMTEDDDEMEMDDEEEIDLDEVIRTLKEMDHDSEEAVGEEDEEEMGAELEEAYKTIESLRKTINEVNLLNAKLLYTNKLFRTFDLNEGQKVKVLENFDRTSSVREVKLVFSTIAENLNVAKKTRTVVKEGYASKATKSSAPKKIISEGNEMAARWKKLAGLK
jgi:hypothetical protein